MQTQEVLSDYERERGKPMPSKFHSITQQNLSIALASYRSRYITLSELTLELDGERVVPDLSIYRREEIDFAEEEIRMTKPPLMTVEIASPTQGVQVLVDKIRFMLGKGVRSCWLVQPALQTVTIFSEEMKKRTVTEGAVTDPVTDIEVKMEDIFETA